MRAIATTRVRTMRADAALAFGLGVVATLLACWSTGARAADVRSVYSAGDWQVFAGVGDDQRQFCEISSGGAAGRRVLVLQQAGDPGLTLQLLKDSWSIPAQTPIDLLIDIDGNRWPFHTTGSGQLVGVSLATAPGFESAFRAGRTMTVSFPGGSEAPWAGSLTSSNAVFNAFDNCRGTLLGQASQPYAAPASQPYAPTATPPAVAAAPAPSQPYAVAPAAPAAAPAAAAPSAPAAPVAPPQGLPPIPSAPPA